MTHAVVDGHFPRDPTVLWRLGMLRLTRRLPVWIASLLALVMVPSLARAASVSLCPQGGDCLLGAQNVVAALVGETVTLEVWLDTEGLTLEGYHYGVDFTNGAVSGIMLTHQVLGGGLEADLLGTPVIDEMADTIRNVNQLRMEAGPGLDPGGLPVLLDLIEFTIDANPEAPLMVTPGALGEVFGLGEGSCPGTVVGCNVTFHAARIVPEPGTSALFGLALAGLGVSRRRARARAR